MQQWLKGFDLIYTIERLENLTELRLAGKNITEIPVQIRCLVNLERLDLHNNQITNLEPLKYLVKLEKLYLENNGIADLEPLKYLVKLEWLGLDNNQITNLEPLKGLVNLERLYLNNNPVKLTLQQVEFIRKIKYHTKITTDMISNLDILKEML
jgi:internalin A